MQIGGISEDVSVLLARWREGKMTEASRAELMAECRARGAKLTVEDFSNIKVEGLSREDACEWLMVRTREKAFGLLRRAFGSTARFRYSFQPVIDFYWSKVPLAVVISGPLTRGSPLTLSYDKFKRYPKSDLEFARSLGWLPGIPRNGVQEMRVPYYLVWHNPSDFVEEIRMKLLASGAYPRMNSATS